MPGPPLLRLVRWPGVATAAADAAAASVLFWCTPGRTASVVAAAALVYGGGVVLNDAVDADRDRTLHPDRPVPSGAVTRRAALLLGSALLAAGVGAAAFAGRATLAAYAAVAVVAAAYDLGLKRWALPGVLAMGLCRGGSVLAAALSSPSYADLLGDAPGRALLLPLPWALLGCAVTAASLLEGSPRARGLVPAAAAGILLPVAVAFPLLADPRSGALGLSITAAALLTFALGSALARDRSPSAVVREGVLGFLLLDAAVLGMRDAWGPSALALALWVALRVALRGGRS